MAESRGSRQDIVLGYLGSIGWLGKYGKLGISCGVPLLCWVHCMYKMWEFKYKKS